MTDNLRMNHLSALLFDVDGTLADTEELHRQAFNRTFTEFGLGWHWGKSEYAQLLAISGGPDRIRHYAQGRSQDPRLCADCTTDFILSLHKAKGVTFRRLIAEQGAALRPGVRRLLEEARQKGIRLALATCTSLKNVQQLLDQNLPDDWPSWFSTIVTAGDLREMKPAPDVYLQALARLQLPASACIAIEDTVNGSKAASAAGLTCVVTTNEFTRECDFPGAKLVVSQLGEPEQPFELLRGSLSSLQNYVNIPMLNDLLLGGQDRSGNQPYAMNRMPARSLNSNLSLLR